MIPEDSRVEIDAKIHSGYFSAGKEITEEDLKQVKGRGWESWEDVTVSEYEPDEESMTADMSFSIDWHFGILLNIDISLMRSDHFEFRRFATCSRCPRMIHQSDNMKRCELAQSI